jgi:hypothetical protein
MDRVVRATLVAAVLFTAACGPAFKERRTPSGEYCSDMPILPAGTDPEREYHRLEPIQSEAKARTEAERLESLRKAACKVGGDAVIEAVNEEVRADNSQYATVSSGTAVLWMRHANATPKPLPVRAKKPAAEPAADASADPAASAAPNAAPSPAPSAVPSAVPADAKSAKPAAGKPPKTAKK